MEWVLQMFQGNNYQLRFVYPTKTPFKTKAKQKLRKGATGWIALKMKMKGHP